MPLTKRNLRNIPRLFFGLPKTLIFNFYYFGLSGIFRPRVILTKKVYLRKLGGVVLVPPHIGLGEIKIGFGDVLGEVHFKGRCLIGHGGKISVRGALFSVKMSILLPKCKSLPERRSCLRMGC